MKFPAIPALAAALLAATLPARAATVLEYEVEGECNTEFDRMVFDGLYARVDATSGGYENTTIFDDGEQMMYFISHESRTVMSIESDDDAVDFHGDVMRSTMIHAEKQTEKVTGVDMQSLIAQAHSAQVAMCPELAEMGYNDPDYADASMKCAKKMQSMGGADPKAQLEAAQAMARNMEGGRRGSARTREKAAPPAAAPQWTTTETTPTGDTSEIEGVTCAHETMRRGDVVLREQCMAEAEALPLDASAKRRLARMMKIGRGMSAGLAESMPGIDPDARARVALQRTCYANGNRTGAASLRIDRDAAVDASLFAVPKDYKPIGTGPDE